MPTVWSIARRIKVVAFYFLLVGGRPSTVYTVRFCCIKMILIDYYSAWKDDSNGCLNSAWKVGSGPVDDFSTRFWPDRLHQSHPIRSIIRQIDRARWKLSKTTLIAVIGLLEGKIRPLSSLWAAQARWRWRSKIQKWMPDSQIKMPVSNNIPSSPCHQCRYGK